MTRRATFGPVVLVGLAASALVAVAAHKPLVSLPREAFERIGAASFGDHAGAGFGNQAVAEDGLPLAGALALVMLASWGVLLVTRGVVRRGVAVLSALVGAGVLVAAVVGIGSLRESYPREVSDMIGLGSRGAEALGVAGTTGWFWALAAGTVVALVAAAAAVVLSPEWPEMGSRYDAPGSAGASGKPLEERHSIDVWKSLDEGDDPTT